MDGHFVRSDMLGKAICEALGIDPVKVAEMIFRIEPGRASSVTLTRYITDVEVVAIQRELEQYSVVRK